MTTSRILSLGLAAAALLGLAAAHPASAQTTYDPAASFSLTSNPNGVFSYGETSTLGGAFSLLPSTVTDSDGLTSYINNAGSDLTNINYNPTATTVSRPYQTFKPGGLSIHSGVSGQFGVVRFTAPTLGVYSFTGSFYPGDPNANNTVNILDNGVSVFSSTRSGGNTTPFTNAGLILKAGDTLDFAVGGPFTDGDTGLAAKITGPIPAVPEASTTVSLGLLLALGLGGTVVAAKRKKAHASS